MTYTVSKKGFGDARLAEKVIEAYAEEPVGEFYWNGEPAQDLHLWTEECSELDIDKERCSKLQGALNYEHLFDIPPTEHNGTITPQEQTLLSQSGFSQEFVSTLAGPDGKRALRARVKWLAEHLRPRWIWGYDKDERIDMIRELGVIGPEAANALPYLMQSVADRDVQKETMDAILKIEPEEFARFFYLGRLCSGANSGYIALVGGLSSADDEKSYCSLQALAMLKQTDHLVTSIFVEESRKWMADEEAFVDFFNEYVNLISPTQEAIDFLGEVVRNNTWNRGGGALGVLRDKRFIPESFPVFLRCFVDGTDVNLRSIAGGYFATTPQSHSYFLDLLDHPNQKTVSEVVQIIVQFRIQVSSSHHLQILIERLEDPSPEERKITAEALGVQGIAAKNALPLLFTMRLNDPDESCRIAARSAMEAIEKEVL